MARAGKGLNALLADLETRGVVVVFKGSTSVVGTIIAGNREVAMVRRWEGGITNVLLSGVMEVFELEGSGLEALHPTPEEIARS